MDDGGRVPSDYRNEGGFATQSLRELVRGEILANGPMSVARYMNLSLYHPDWGYYTRGNVRVGKQGDFFTSVSVGPLFGDLMASWMAGVYREIGAPPAWRVVEFGGNDGKLAADVMDGIRRRSPAAFDALEYVISEPLPSMRQEQEKRLGRYPVRVVADTGSLVELPMPGLVFGNEVLDALPFELVEWRDGSWVERCVEIGPDGSLVLGYGSKPKPKMLELLDSGIHADVLPEGWQCELRTGMSEFIGDSMRGLLQPRMLWIDYGFDRGDLWNSARSGGTWQAYRNHRIIRDPWNLPGDCDLTAHVDFTAVREAVGFLGGEMLQSTRQGVWLTRLAAEELTAREGTSDPSWVRQFQMLTHPAQLGSKFTVLEFACR